MGTASQHGPPPPYESVIMSDAVRALIKMPRFGPLQDMQRNGLHLMHQEHIRNHMGLLLRQVSLY